jgi:hypothetical protein
VADIPETIVLKRHRDLEGRASVRWRRGLLVVLGVFLAAGTVAVCTVLVSFLSFRVRRLRPLLDGEPVVLLQDGR